MRGRTKGGRRVGAGRPRVLNRYGLIVTGIVLLRSHRQASSTRDCHETGRPLRPPPSPDPESGFQPARTPSVAAITSPPPPPLSHPHPPLASHCAMTAHRSMTAALAVAVATLVVSLSASTVAAAPPCKTGVPDGAALHGVPPATVNARLADYIAECDTYRRCCTRGSGKGALAPAAACKRCIRYCVALADLGIHHGSIDALQAGADGGVVCSERSGTGGAVPWTPPPSMAPWPPVPTPVAASTPAPTPVAALTTEPTPVASAEPEWTWPLTWPLP